MRSDFINKDADIKSSELCTYDSNIGYETDFNRNGDVDGWDYFDGIHTYGCWDGFIFGTLYGSYGIVGRKTVFIATPCETYYHVRIAMKYNPVAREGIHPLPTTASLRWRTLADSNWSSAKQHDFTLHADNKWHTYIINMGEEQYWQGDVNDLRLHVATEHGQSGDEFFIRTIQIFSISNYICTNANCSYYTRFEHLCPGAGKRAYIESKKIPENTTFNVSKDDEIIVNINEYGDEIFNLEEVINGSVYQIAFFLTKAISIVNIGGYAEARVVYEDGRFRIYGGTYSSDSTIVIYDNPLTRLLGFFGERGQAVYNFSPGESPASGFSPWCSFRARTFELLSLFDNSDKSSLNFNPFIPSIQGGRSDWFSSLGFTSNDATNASADGTSIPVRRLHAVIRGTDPNTHDCIQENFKIIKYGTAYTIIDFNNPFNASGRITKIYAAVTLDPPDLDTIPAGVPPGGGSTNYYDQKRRAEEVKGAKILVLRPRKNGYYKIIHEIPIPDRDRPSNIGIGGKLYSITQESIELDVNIFVNRGDVLGVYAANVYVGKSILGSQIDAQYFRKEGKPTEDFHPGPLRGEGSAGLILYACSSEYQKRLTIDIDLRRRYNVKNVLIKGEPQKQYLEYNVLRCLDANQFQGDTFGLNHLTAHKTMVCPDWFMYIRANTMYGLNRLTDGIRVAKDGYAADNFTVTWDWLGCCNCPRIQDPAGPGVVPTNPQYFWINGDEEWLAKFLHAQWFMHSQVVKGFSHAKFALTVYFPLKCEKKIYRTAIYFKERTNFRSFAFSVYKGDEYLAGNADDNHFDYIPGYKSIILDGVTYEEGSPLYSQVDKYLFVNPTIGEAIQEYAGYYYDYSPTTGSWIQVTQYTVTNHDQWLQALNTDWRTIEHEFEPIAAQGFRIYCDYHLSTKICEIELYCSAQDVGSNMSGGIKFTYSDYGDIWFAPEGTELEEGITELVIGDTPRYMQIELMPITEIKYNDIVIGIQSEDVFVGKKGCEYEHYMIDAEKGKEGDSQVVELKNVYDVSYDLYVDIPPETVNSEGILFYSHMDTPESITNPEFGPDAIYYKEQDYPLTFKNHNCAINCECWGLKNLVHGKTAQFKKCDRLEWDEFGVIDQNTNLNFTNVGASNRSILYLPILSRNRYWKIAHKNPDALTYVREMRVLKDEVEQPVDFYYEIGERRWGPNLCTGGTASASSSYSGRTPSGAFDNNTTTYWSPGTGSSASWLRYDLPSPQIVQGLRIKTDISASQYQPRSFALQASVSGTFTGADVTDLLVARKFYSYDSSAWAEWSFVSNVTPYRYYRLYITTNGYDTVGEMYNLRIYEMELVRPSYYRDFYNKPLERRAPHLDNGSVLGSYYKIENNTCIGFDVGSQDNVSSLLMYHNAFDDIDTLCGLDSAAWSYVKAEGSRLGYTIKDISYYENPISISGSIFKENDNDFRTVTWSKHEDFVDCDLSPDWKTIIGTGYGGSYDNCSGTGNCTSAYDCVPASGVDLGYMDFRITGSYSNTSGRFIETNYTEGDNKTRFQINETSVLEFRYKIQFDAMDSSATINKYGTISIGLESGFTAYASSPIGLHVCFDYNADTGASSSYLALNGDASANYVWSSRTQTIIPSGVGAVQIGVIYYIEVTSDGKGRYSASIWTDNWNGSALVGTANITAYEKWYANKLGMFYYTSNPLFDGKIYEIHCDVETKISLKQIGGSLRVDNNNSYLEVAHNYGFDLGKSGHYSKYAAIELFAMFDRLPLPNEKFILFQNWGSAGGNNYMVYLSNNGTDFTISYNVGGAVQTITVDFFADRWYHFAFTKVNSIGSFGSNTSVYNININGGVVGTYYTGQSVDLGRSTNSVKIGIGFTGWISNFRFSSDKRPLGARTIGDPYIRSFPVPVKEYTHRYTYSIYSSFDNITFGKYADVDLFNGYTDVFYNDESTLGSFYNSYFAIDLNQRHNLDIIRSYNNASAFGFDYRKYISYSKDDISDVENVSFVYTDDISDNFEGLGKPNTFLWSYVDNVDLYLDTNKVRMQLHDTVRTQELKSKYTLIGDFDIRVSYSILESYNIVNWYAGLGIENVINNNRVYIFRSFSSPDSNCYYSTDHTGTMSFTRKTSETVGTLKIRRRGQTITTYFKKGTEWETLDQWVGWSFDDVRVVLYAYNTGLYPALSVYFDNFESPLFLTNSPDSSIDARWVRVNMPNGDTTTRQLYKIGVYPDIRDRFAPSEDKPNSYWDSLGSAVTNYDEGVNLGPASEVTASSYIEGFLPSNATNGTVGTTLNETWASGQGQSQWINLDFGEIKSIYRVKLYLGYNENDSTMLATAYKIQISTDGVTYTDVFNITSNTSFVRTHDLMTPVSTRHVRVYISAYKYRQMYVLSGDTMVLFTGVTMREIEVYESYGFTTISSEIYPIMAVNLREQFYISGHEVIGVDTESTATALSAANGSTAAFYDTTDWDNLSSSFAYSDSVFTDPSKVEFRSFGGTPSYDQWVAVRRNTATNYGIPYSSSTATYINMSGFGVGTDYLKHVKIKASDALNPCDYFWWWSSNLSKVTRSFNTVSYCTYPLKIEYPASAVADNIYIRPGDNFGVDTMASWRDGLSFRLHIDDLDNLDLSYGYFYIRGIDATSVAAPVEYRWYFSTLSGTGLLQSGWCWPFLSFKYADEVIYNTDRTSALAEDKNPLRVDEATFDSIGFIFRGKGNPITMYFDGFVIGRNHFSSYSAFGQGLYLTGNDVLTCPLGGFDLTGGTIEFWIRPDWTFTGQDNTNRFKSRSIFHFGNAAGDIFGMTVGSRGLYIYYGDTITPEVFTITGLSETLEIDGLYHMAVVFSCNGIATGDGSTIKLYINNHLMAKHTLTWKTYDNKLFKFIFGGQGLLSVKEGDATYKSSSIDSVISNLKIYSFCKLDFADSIANISDDFRVENIAKPSELIEISRDNVTFYKVGDPNLPFFFYKVPPGTVVPIYVKTDLPSNLTGAEKRTSAIVSSWDVGV